MCHCREREHVGVDVRRLNVDAETRQRLERFGAVTIEKRQDGVKVTAGGLSVIASDGIEAVRQLAELAQEMAS